MKVIMFEDKQQVVRDIVFCLEVRFPKTEVIAVAEVQKGMNLLKSESSDLVMVDSSLPNIDTIDMIGKIREISDVPLIILCDAENDLDRARGLEAGADDYINKPFSPIELLARVNALLRRTKGQGVGYTQSYPISVDDGLTVNLATREVFLSGKQVKLTRIEFELLSLLVRNEGKVLTNRSLLEKVWGSEYTDELAFVKKYIYRLRTKLESNAGRPARILNERGIGYKFVKDALTILVVSFIFTGLLNNLTGKFV